MLVGRALFLLAAAVAAAGAQCSVPLSALQPRQPLLLRPDLGAGRLDARAFLHVEQSASLGPLVRVPEGQPVLLACPGGGNHLAGGGAPALQEVTAICIGGTRFSVGDEFLDLHLVSCARVPLHEAWDTRERCDALSFAAALVRVGFRLGAAGFVSLYEICFDHARLAALSARTLLVAGARAPVRPADADNPFDISLFGDVNPAGQYHRGTQAATFAKLLGEEQAYKYITSSTYLANASLTPPEDFAFAPQQAATRFFFNAVPMWNALANSHWRALEEALRDQAQAQGDLRIVTSALGEQRLPSASGYPVPVYLYVDGLRRAMPVPEYVLKDVVREADGVAVAYARFLNRAPDVAAGSALAPPCDDVCHLLGWLPWRHQPPASRSVFCCRPDDPQLKTRVRGLPELPAGLPLL